MSSVMRLHAVGVLAVRSTIRYGVVGYWASCESCPWRATLMDPVDAERHAQRHRALTAREEDGQQ